MHLVKEGTFLRAYQWSAWLCVRHFPDLKVTHRVLKGGEDIVFVGFPLTSLERYTPEGAVAERVDETGADLLLPTSVLEPEATAQTLLSDFANWKQSQPLTEASRKREAEEKREAERRDHPRLTDVMLRIMAYPIEQHSPMECMAFLSEVKQQISEIL